MQSFCSLALDADYSKHMANPTRLALVFYQRLLEYIFEAQVGPRLVNHYCDISAPCAVLRRAMQACIRYLLVCRSWNELATPILSRRPFAILKAPLQDGYFLGSAATVARRNTLGGRYRAQTIIESDPSPSAVASIMHLERLTKFLGKSVLGAFDYGSVEGCHSAIAIIIKISDERKDYETEKEVYIWLADVKTRPSYMPQLFLGDEYSCGKFYGLVLSKLGPDLQRLQSGFTPHQRFTPKMTLAVAIQTVYISSFTLLPTYPDSI